MITWSDILNLSQLVLFGNKPLHETVIYNGALCDHGLVDESVLTQTIAWCHQEKKHLLVMTKIYEDTRLLLRGMS